MGQGSTSSNGKSTAWSSTSFGLDGSGDEPPKQSSSTDESAPATDAKEEVFQRERLGPMNVEQPKGVDKVSANGHEKEQEYMERRLRENTKTE